MNVVLQNSLKNLEEEKKRLSQLQSVYDSQLSDIMHYIQINQVDNDTAIKLVGKIATIRQKRQSIKEELKEVTSVIQKIENSFNKDTSKKYAIRTDILNDITEKKILE